MTRTLVDLLSAQQVEPLLAQARFTHGGFAAAAHSGAAWLLDAGMKHGDRVLVDAEDSTPLRHVAFFAAALAGGIAVPVHPKLKDRQVQHVLDDADPFAVFLSANKRVFLTDPDRFLRGRVEIPESAFESTEAVPIEGHCSPDDAAVLLYSSGSTGTPKGIVQTHGNLVDGARIVADFTGLRPSDHVLGVLSTSFDYGLNQLLAAMLVGCRITFIDYLSIHDAVAAVHTHGCTTWAGVPSIWSDLAAMLASDQAGDAVTATVEALATLRLVTSSGGRLDPSDIKKLRTTLPGCAIYSMYGLTEAFRSACLLPAALIDERPESFGRAVPEVDLLLVEPGTDRVLHGATEGELVHAGAFIAKEYWRRPEETAARFIADLRPDAPAGSRAVRSGDLVVRDAEGFFTFKGRLDGLLKVSGHRLSPNEVESAALREPGVLEAVCLGLEDGSRGHRLALCIVFSKSEESNVAKLRKALRAALPAWMVPAEIHGMDRLPRTPNGKPDRKALAKQLEERPDVDG